ncbi:triphosphoribosyl-dephospho-CoA synthase [Methanofollis aquaemaris]|uniref:Triphosphoribosyl-dephospho-CoA synthase n=1 Tax=Methanofollis aquaemaris TaxID=126734 RepID=A0A8A3S4T2_9EURY|nr:triphosphoribosyl-dephospho-CoA synthase [Methanofollis aquaemaris]QSZ66700.1 triphosphoribosyl-dephospho-CoA synthase [Methanofollis aquaemaris]
MECRKKTRVENAQLAMALEVSASPKPGNVDRGHDYPDTRLEHFLASAVFAGRALDLAEEGKTGIGEVILEAVKDTNCHAGGNTHFGAFILLVPLVHGGGVDGAMRAVQETTVEDAVAFYRAFGATQVRVLETDDLDVNDPAALDTLRKQGMTLYDVMAYSAPRDMVAREWTNGFALSQETKDLLFAHGSGKEAIVQAFLDLLAAHPDTFVAKKLGADAARRTMERAGEVKAGEISLEVFDEECLAAGVNPGSLADIMIAGIYLALSEGWRWDS